MNTTYRTTAITVQEYHGDYPWTSPNPTLTQNRMLWFLLARQSEKEAARRRRQAQWRLRTAVIRYAFAHPWRALNGEYPAHLA